MEKTQCDAVRTFAHNTVRGSCTPCPKGCAATDTCPNNCYDSTQSAAPGYCQLGNMATRLDYAFNDKYSPSGFASGTGRKLRIRKMQADQMAINSFQQQLKQEFPSVSPTDLDVSWFGMSKCMWNPDGSVGGADQTRYFNRNELELMGYQPRPLINVNALSGKISPKVTNIVPIWMDRVFNPELAVLVIFILLVIIFGVLLYNAYQWAQGAKTRAAIAKELEREKLEKTDPYRGTAFESWPDPNKKIRQYIEAQEAAGYDMTKYRQQYLLPPKGAL